ncbi:MAG: hypothetical protein JWL91_928 [Sphingomonas bacterium]|jgi:hypothetical protein|nr:hypothetical protein [Sphingomonas bacterium]MDB5689052.1 hypothetical protein [Sphingomonas bacterium]
MKRIGHAVLGAASLVAAAWVVAPSRPAEAQSRTIPTYTVFGNDPCPRDYICVRLSESDRYRIPKELRGETGIAAAERWGDRVQALEYAGASGINSCSPVGSGGTSGCFRQLTQQARAEQRARGEEPAIPLDLP